MRDEKRKKIHRGVARRSHRPSAYFARAVLFICFAGILLPACFAGNVHAAKAVAFSPQIDRYVEGEVQRFLAGTGVFDTVEASVHIAVEASRVRELEHRYGGTEDGAKIGEEIKGEERTYEAEADGYTQEEAQTDYLPGETFTQIVTPGGILPEESSMAVTAVIREVYEEDALRESGALSAGGFARFKEEHGEEREPETEREYAGILSRGTGIPEENITVIVRRTPVFVDSREKDGEILRPVLLGCAGALVLAVLFLAVRRGAVGKTKKRKGKGGEGTKGGGNGESRGDRGNSESRKGGGSGVNRRDGGKSPATQDGDGMSEAERYIRRYIDRNPGEASGKFRDWKDRSGEDRP